MSRRVNEETADGRIILVTGMSGAGLSSGLKALEDLGFEDAPDYEYVKRLLAEMLGVNVGLVVVVHAAKHAGARAALSRPLTQRQACR